MPEQVLPDLDDFLRIREALVAAGFEEKSRLMINWPLRKFLGRSRCGDGSEIGFIYRSRELRVVVWTTWVPDVNEARQMDSGWVLIARGDSVPYFAHPLCRTKGFVEKLIRCAMITKSRLDHRPTCPECKRPMDIAQRKDNAIKARFWACENIRGHSSRRRNFCEWDHGLSDEDKAFLKAERKSRKRYRDKRRAAGFKTPAAVLERAARKRNQ